jgi:OOP family OmpA-OmpF porin
MKNFRRALTAAAATALLGGGSSIALAQAPAIGTYPQLPWYIGVGAGVGNLSRSPSDLTGLNNATLDDNDTSYTVRGGWRFSPFFAVELGYYDFGRYHFDGTAVGNRVPIDGSVRAQSVGLSLVGIIPINNFDIYGRVGYAHSKLNFNANGELTNRTQNDRQDEATYGAGVRWTFAPHWVLFAEWAKNDKIRVDSYMGGVDFRF